MISFGEKLIVFLNIFKIVKIQIEILRYAFALFIILYYIIYSHFEAGEPRSIPDSKETLEPAGKSNDDDGRRGRSNSSPRRSRRAVPTAVPGPPQPDAAPRRRSARAGARDHRPPHGLQRPGPRAPH